MYGSTKFYMWLFCTLMLLMLTCALNEHKINKRVLPIHTNCDPGFETRRKGDWIVKTMADCKYKPSLQHPISCDAQNDVPQSWTVDVAQGDRCKPVSGLNFECGADGTNTRCVCSDTNLAYNPKANECRCQYWPQEDPGANSPAFCTGYYTGGTSTLHHWACCNNCNDQTPLTCDGTTWHGGTNTNYCGSCGENTGGGRVKYYFNCGSCAKQQACSNKCNGYNFPGLCWRWLDCFKGCCLANQPGNKRNVSELSFCGDGTCSDGETPASCPADCCYQINSINCTSNIHECEPECCHAPNCCLGDNNNNNKKSSSNKGVTVGIPKSSSNKGATVGIPIVVVVATIAIVIAIVAIVYYKRKKQILCIIPTRYEKL